MRKRVYVIFMRPLVHPAIDDVSVEGILHALSDPVRVSIFTEIAASACTATCTAFSQVAERPIPKSTLSQHFKILREAGLIRSERHGVEMQSTSRCTEINLKFPGLIPSIVGAHLIQQKGSTRSGSGRRKTATRA